MIKYSSRYKQSQLTNKFNNPFKNNYKYSHIHSFIWEGFILSFRYFSNIFSYSILNLSIGGPSLKQLVIFFTIYLSFRQKIYVRIDNFISY